MSFNISYIFKALDQFSPVAKQVRRAMDAVNKAARSTTKSVATISTSFNRLESATIPVQKLNSQLGKMPAKVEASSRAVTKLSARFKIAAERAGQIGKSLALRITAPLAAVGIASIRAAGIQQKAEANVAAGVKALGGQSALSTEQLKAMASQLQSVSTFGDEDILQGGIAQLLTFTSIAKSAKIFTGALAASLDLAAKKGISVSGAVSQLGKALADPVGQLGLLARSGVIFSKKQKDLIKTLVESNRLFDAQQIVLKKFKLIFGGTAKSLAETDIGVMKQALNDLGDASESVGFVLLRFLRPFNKSISKLSIGFQKLSPPVKKAIVQLGAIAAVIPLILISLGLMVPLIRSVSVALTFLAANPIVIALIAIVGAIAFVIANFDRFKRETMDVVRVVTDVWVSFKNKFESIGNRISGVIDIITGTNGFKKFAKVLDIIKKPIDGLESALDKLISSFQSFISLIGKVSGLTGSFKSLGKFLGIGGKDGGITGPIASKFTRATIFGAGSKGGAGDLLSQLLGLGTTLRPASNALLDSASRDVPSLAFQKPFTQATTSKSKLDITMDIKDKGQNVQSVQVKSSGDVEFNRGQNMVTT